MSDVDDNFDDDQLDTDAVEDSLSLADPDDDLDNSDELTVPPPTPARGRNLVAIRRAIEERQEARRLRQDLDYIELELDLDD